MNGLAKGDTTATAVPVTPPDAARNVLLAARDLHVQFRHGRKWITVVDGFSLDIHVGETVGIVGESGSGKTAASLALMDLIAHLGGRSWAESLQLGGRDLLSLDPTAWNSIRGRDVGMIFQQPTQSLNPAFRVGDQIAETIRRHVGVSRAEAWRRAVEALDRVRIPNAAARARGYAHEFSGGQAQRIMIAMAIACQPKLLIADEPTTALDVTVQRQVLDLLAELQRETQLAILLISHDLALIAERCARTAVMYAGQIVEQGRTGDIIHSPRHPYTAALLRSMPAAIDASKRLRVIPGSVPSFLTPPTGCRFHPRCEHRLQDVCTTAAIGLRALDDQGHLCRCARAEEITPGAVP